MDPLIILHPMVLAIQKHIGIGGTVEITHNGEPLQVTWHNAHTLVINGEARGIWSIDDKPAEFRVFVCDDAPATASVFYFGE